MKKFIIPTILVALVIGVVAFKASASAAPSHPSRFSTECVDPHKKGCYTTVQTAVNAATKGATIDVAAGTYHEEVTISNTAVSLIGHKAIIDANGLANGIVVNGTKASGTTIKGFTIENAKLEGVLIDTASHINFQNNTVKSNDTNLVTNPNPNANKCDGALPLDQADCGEGVHLLGASYSTLINNIIENNAGGVLSSDEAGPVHNNTIANNIVENNTADCGITLASHAANEGVYNNIVSHNVSMNNGGAGVGLFTPMPGTTTHNNTIINNTLKGNADGGVTFHSHSAGTDLNANKVIGNIISNNKTHAAPLVPTGIVVFADATGHSAPITNTTITGNTISNETIDIYVGTAQTELTLHTNNLLGGQNVIGVENQGSAGTVDASKNYWGCPTGPGRSNCTTTQGSVNTAFALIR
jgi:Right handed beta helix region